MSNYAGNNAHRSQTQAKLVLLGDMGAGKSSLVLRFVKGQFFEHQESTIGAAFMTQTVTVDDHVVKFEIWDTAGQERYKAICGAHYKRAKGALLVYDVTSRETFDELESWIENLMSKAEEEI